MRVLTGILCLTAVAAAKCDFGVTIKFPQQHKSAELTVACNEKVQQLKADGAAELGVNASDLVLSYNNVELSDTRTVGYYKIKGGSVIMAEVEVE